jgi:hypothetical protein
MNKSDHGLEAELDALQRDSFSYFVHEPNPVNGLVIDKTAPNWPASIAATGFALAAYPVGVERKLLSGAAAVKRTLATLRFFASSPHAGATFQVPGRSGLCTNSLLWAASTC